MFILLAQAGFTFDAPYFAAEIAPCHKESKNQSCEHVPSLEESRKVHQLCPAMSCGRMIHFLEALGRNPPGEPLKRCAGDDA